MKTRRFARRLLLPPLPPLKNRKRPLLLPFLSPWGFNRNRRYCSSVPTLPYSNRGENAAAASARAPLGPSYEICSQFSHGIVPLHHNSYPENAASAKNLSSRVLGRSTSNGSCAKSRHYSLYFISLPILKVIPWTVSTQ